jgi:hypothetical protein
MHAAPLRSPLPLPCSQFYSIILLPNILLLLHNLFRKTYPHYFQITFHNFLLKRIKLDRQLHKNIKDIIFLYMYLQALEMSFNKIFSLRIPIQIFHSWWRIYKNLLLKTTTSINFPNQSSGTLSLSIHKIFTFLSDVFFSLSGNFFRLKRIRLRTSPLLLCRTGKINNYEYT